MSAKRIFVTNDIGHDLRPALEHGEIHAVLFQGIQNIFDVNRIAIDCRLGLKEFNPKTDLLLMCGSNVISAYCMGVLLSWHSRVPTLVWNAKYKRYAVLEWRV